MSQEYSALWKVQNKEERLQKQRAFVSTYPGTYFAAAVAQQLGAAYDAREEYAMAEQYYRVTYDYNKQNVPDRGSAIVAPLATAMIFGGRVEEAAAFLEREAGKPDGKKAVAEILERQEKGNRNTFHISGGGWDFQNGLNFELR
jgi:hypothetical protein